MKRATRLSAAFVKTIREPGRYGEGHGGKGLSLLVKRRRNDELSKSWSQRLRINGRPFNIGLGSYPLVSLKDARAAALENAQKVARGVDPRAVDSREPDVPTFAEAAEAVINLKSKEWRQGSKSEKLWRSSLRDYAVPKLGHRRVSEITRADVHSVLESIWWEKPETARRVRQRISKIMQWSIVKEYRQDNPAGEALNVLLPKRTGTIGHHRALHHSKVAEAVEIVKSSPGAWPMTKLCFEFMVLTAARSGEVRGAMWDEMNLDDATWIVPAERMKALREHQVPLSSRAKTILRDASEFTDGSGLVFPSLRGKPLSDSTLSKLLRELGVNAVPHGFRSTFRDWCAETGEPRELAEAALAHTVRGVEGAYLRSRMLERRRELMQRWSDHVTSGAGV